MTHTAHQPKVSAQSMRGHAPNSEHTLFSLGLMEVIRSAPSGAGLTCCLQKVEAKCKWFLCSSAKGHRKTEEREDGAGRQVCLGH